MIKVLAGLILGCGAEPVAPGLDDTAPGRRKDALYALGPVGVKSQLDAVMAIAASDPEPTIRRLALGLLGPTGDPRVVPLLKDALLSWDDTSMQLTAATALGNVQHAAACPVMVDAFVVWPSERDPVLTALRSSLVASDPHCNDAMRERKVERPDRIGPVLLEISRSR